MSSKYTAVIIEPRQHKALHFVLNNFLENLNDEWNVIIFHGKQNYNYIMNIIETILKNYEKRIKLIDLGIENLTLNDYNNLLKSSKFYNFIPTETFMIFQTDSMILPKYKHYINYFLNYDYVGAPWNNKLVGNGGLSLRKKSKMIEIIKSKGYVHLNEDIYFSSDINNNIQYNVPDYTIARMFSVETLFYDRPFGVHNCWRYLNKENLDVLINKYSDLQELINLQ